MDVKVKRTRPKGFYSKAAIQENKQIKKVIFNKETARPLVGCPVNRGRNTQPRSLSLSSHYLWRTIAPLINIGKLLISTCSKFTQEKNRRVQGFTNRRNHYLQTKQSIQQWENAKNTVSLSLKPILVQG